MNETVLPASDGLVESITVLSSLVLVPLGGQVYLMPLAGATA